MSAEAVRPLIGLPGRRISVGRISGFPDSLGQLDADLYFADYARSVLQAGGLPVHLPMDADPSKFVSHLDAIVLTGGADLDPELYGQPNTASSVEPERDSLEWALLDAAVRQDLPVLGICRGLQLINVYFGGTLHQDIDGHARYDVDPDRRIHTVRFRPDTELASLYADFSVGPDPAGELSVNSLHHQSVDRVGNGLTVSAQSDDGTVEGLEWPERRIVSVQWHPEMLAEMEPVFAWVVHQARARRIS